MNLIGTCINTINKLQLINIHLNRMTQPTARDDESNYVISSRPLVFANPRASPISPAILHGMSVTILLPVITPLLRGLWF